MNYGRAKRETLRHIMAYKIAGVEVASTYNNQADYIDKIPGLINDCQEYIATTKKFIPAHIMISDLTYTEFGEYNIVYLPYDCWRFHQLLKTDGTPLGLEFYIRRPDSLWIKKGVGLDLFFEYWRHSVEVPEDPDDNFELDNTPDAQVIVPYYVAAHIVRYDSAFDYSALYNEFETRLQRLTMPSFAELSPVESTFGPVINTFIGVG